MLYQRTEGLQIDHSVIPGIKWHPKPDTSTKVEHTVRARTTSFPYILVLKHGGSDLLLHAMPLAATLGGGWCRGDFRSNYISVAFLSDVRAFKFTNACCTCFSISIVYPKWSFRSGWPTTSTFFVLFLSEARSYPKSLIVIRPLPSSFSVRYHAIMALGVETVGNQEVLAYAYRWVCTTDN